MRLFLLPGQMRKKDCRYQLSHLFDRQHRFRESANFVADVDPVFRDVLRRIGKFFRYPPQTLLGMQGPGNARQELSPPAFVALLTAGEILAGRRC